MTVQAHVLEDGSGVAGATTYYTLASVAEYCANMGYTSWASLASDTLWNAAIYRGMRYMESRPWKGWKANEDNNLEWPRTGIVDRNGYVISSTEIPINVKYALAEASYRESATANIMQEDLDRGGAVKREKTDVIETEYFRNASPSWRYPSVDGLLKGLIEGKGSLRIART